MGFQLSRPTAGGKFHAPPGTKKSYDSFSQNYSQNYSQNKYERALKKNHFNKGIKTVIIRRLKFRHPRNHDKIRLCA